MRMFRSVADRMEAERNLKLWTPPLVLRRIAWIAGLAAVVYQIVIMCQMMLYLLAVQNNPAYELTLKWPGSPLQFPVLLLILCCLSLAKSRNPTPKARHVPDPALSILPR